MRFDEVYIQLLEDLDTSYSQLYKYPKFTASATTQGPVRYGPAPAGFKGDKDGIEASKIDGRLFPQKNNLSKKEKAKIKDSEKNSDLKNYLIDRLKELKSRKKY